VDSRKSQINRSVQIAAENHSMANNFITKVHRMDMHVHSPSLYLKVPPGTPDPEPEPKPDPEREPGSDPDLIPAIDPEPEPLPM
jgi:hypothetical protein